MRLSFFLSILSLPLLITAQPSTSERDIETTPALAARTTYICGNPFSVAACTIQGKSTDANCACITTCSNPISIALCTAAGRATNTDCTCASGSGSGTLVATCTNSASIATCKSKNKNCNADCSCGTCTSLAEFECAILGGTLSSSCSCVTPSKTKRRRDATIDKNQCRSSETACRVNNGFTSSTKSSFECIDTENNVDSCGGCVSEGAGQDCTAIEGVDEVVCVASQCVVVSCEPFYTLNNNGTACVPEVRITNAQRLGSAALRGAEKFWGM